ncbi:MULTISPECIES: hypothetical protein [unclassified Nonomuraea]
MADRETVGFRYGVVVAVGDHGEEGTRHLADQGRAVLGVRA